MATMNSISFEGACALRKIRVAVTGLLCLIAQGAHSQSSEQQVQQDLETSFARASEQVGESRAAVAIARVLENRESLFAREDNDTRWDQLKSGDVVRVTVYSRQKETNGPKSGFGLDENVYPFARVIQAPSPELIKNRDRSMEDNAIYTRRKLVLQTLDTGEILEDSFRRSYILHEWDVITRDKLASPKGVNIRSQFKPDSDTVCSLQDDNLKDRVRWYAQIKKIYGGILEIEANVANGRNAQMFVNADDCISVASPKPDYVKLNDKFTKGSQIQFAADEGGDSYEYYNAEVIEQISNITLLVRVKKLMGLLEEVRTIQARQVVSK